MEDSPFKNGAAFPRHRSYYNLFARKRTGLFRNFRDSHGGTLCEIRFVRAPATCDYDGIVTKYKRLPPGAALRSAPVLPLRGRLSERRMHKRLCITPAMIRRFHAQPCFVIHIFRSKVDNFVDNFSFLFFFYNKDFSRRGRIDKKRNLRTCRIGEIRFII